VAKTSRWRLLLISNARPCGAYAGRPGASNRVKKQLPCFLARRALPGIAPRADATRSAGIKSVTNRSLEGVSCLRERNLVGAFAPGAIRLPNRWPNPWEVCPASGTTGLELASRCCFQQFPRNHFCGHRPSPDVFEAGRTPVDTRARVRRGCPPKRESDRLLGLLSGRRTAAPQARPAIWWARVPASPAGGRPSARCVCRRVGGQGISASPCAARTAA